MLYKALAGTPDNSAVPGYHPQLSSELYTTNGEADGHAANVNGMAMFTPEMSTCQTASAYDPDDAWEPRDCRSIFTFPDDEALIQQEFEKNVPFALSVAETAAHPDRPSSSVGLEAADFTPAAFTTSYARGADQEVSVVVRKSVRDKELRYRVNGGRTHSADLRTWRGGERYGGEDDLYFDEYRAEVRHARPGDRVQVWFTGKARGGKKVSSKPFTYTVAERPRADVLVVSEEGAKATGTKAYSTRCGRTAGAQPSGTSRRGRAGRARRAEPLPHRRPPHRGGRPGRRHPAPAAGLPQRGRPTDRGGRAAGGSVDLGDGVLSDDFSQYYLGAYSRTATPGATAFTGAGRLAGTGGPLGDAPGNPLDGPGSFALTSDELPPATYPQFRSAGCRIVHRHGQPVRPYAGSSMAAAVHTDDGYKRLTRTVDLTGVTAAERPTLRTRLLWDTEPGYDNVIVEARTAGGDDWTTLPEAGGATRATVPAECAAGFYIAGHPGWSTI